MIDVLENELERMANAAARARLDDFAETVARALCKLHEHSVAEMSREVIADVVSSEWAADYLGALMKMHGVVVIDPAAWPNVIMERERAIAVERLIRLMRGKP